MIKALLSSILIFTISSIIIAFTVGLKAKDAQIIAPDYSKQLITEEQLTEETETAKINLKKQSLLKPLSLSIGALAIFIIIILYSQYRQKKKNLKIIEQKYIELKNISEKLMRSETTLKEKNLANEKLFTLIASDLRMSINSFLGMSKFIVNSFEDLNQSEVKNSIKELSDEASKLSGQLENLLIWSRVQTENIDFEPEKIDIHEIVQHTIFEYKKALSNKNISVVNEIEPETYAYADMKMTIIILNNLLSNSIKFGKMNGEIIFTALECCNIVLISIQDNGIGLTEQDDTKLFGLDNHTGKTDNGTNKGSGLGLIICKELIERNNGYISTFGKQGEGTIITFALPKYLTQMYR